MRKYIYITCRVIKKQIAQLEQNITISEVYTAVERLQNRQSDWGNEIADAVIKANEEWITPVITKILDNSHNKITMPTCWIGGIVTFL